MNIQTLQQIYPEAIKQAHATKNPNYFVFEEGHDFLWVPVHNLSKTERQLLQTFFKPKKIGQNVTAKDKARHTQIKKVLYFIPWMWQRLPNTTRTPTGSPT